MTCAPRLTTAGRTEEPVPSRAPMARFCALPVSGTTLALLPAACTSTQPTRTLRRDAYGFGLGPWNGIIAPLTFMGSSFSDAMRVYAMPDVGRWYDIDSMSGLSGFACAIYAWPGRRG